jgi:hypothetical protein
VRFAADAFRGSRRDNCGGRVSTSRLIRRLPIRSSGIWRLRGMYVARRKEDGDKDTMVIQTGEEGRLRLRLPDMS